MRDINVLLASAGRRPYLAKWFREGLVLNGVNGRIIVADVDPLAAAQGFADDFITAPKLDDSAYADWLSHLLVDRGISLAASLNDFELSTWSRMSHADAVLSPLIRLTDTHQAIVEDKLRMTDALASVGLSVPSTNSASEFASRSPHEKLVVKGRYGSGSRGLALVDGAGWETAVDKATQDVTDRQGRQQLVHGMSNRDLVLVQPFISGQEFGLDVVSDLVGNFVTVLARKKLSMRGGETDKAMSVDGAPFLELGRRIAQVTQHRGLIDVDVIVDDEGKMWVIDVNPRFGGGYPFSHAAGANVPAAYIAWLIGNQPVGDWLRPTPFISAAKYVDIARVGASQ